MSKTDSTQLNVNSTGDSRTPHGTVDEQPWEDDWQTLKRERDERPNAVPEKLLQKRKGRHLARERDISVTRAARLIRNGEVEVDDEEVL